ncbi:proline dehydrogenase family protein [Paraconexibacter antarcticus]|uniref:Proline dehydrogenase family protein n=1 Tax=Paraconexibacter antarcticus TaxID=2949664 RepID=A0ABY5DTM7_9ACTN|nr:proline dehydrogenase family protein [Paraconexibacter antarcticus]UTI64157.1 proline dehydrogenase family protein [Paraconexibacter antarcticus]
MPPVATPTAPAGPVPAEGDPAPPPPAVAGVEAAIPAIGTRLAKAMGRHHDPRAAIEARMMDRIADRPDLRAAIFRLVDVRPACRDYPDIAEHLAALLDEVAGRPPEGPVRSGDLPGGELPVPLGLARSLARRHGSRTLVGVAGAAGVRAMAGRFIAGEDAADALPAVRRLWKDGIATSVDLLGEATVSEAEADAYRDRCIEVLRTLSAGSARFPARPLLEHDQHGELPRVNLSVKVSALTPHLRAGAPGRGAASAAPRLREILRVARDLHAHVHVDMESLDHREAVRDLTLSLLAEPEFAAGPSAGIVHQAYLTDAAAELEVLLGWARRTPRAQPLSIRLVKGAYWDHEVVEAQQAGWTVPVFTDRRACDREYERLTDTLLDHADLVRPLIASHNLRSVAHAIAAQRARGLEPDAVEYQVLRGLGDPLAAALAAEGLRVRTYCPIGDLVAGMAYLVRRLLENTANDSFLRAHASGTALDRLLEAP